MEFPHCGLGKGPLFNSVFCEVFIVKVLFTLSLYGLNFDLSEFVFIIFCENNCTNILII